MNLAGKLKKARENAKLSQNEVAEKLNISRQAISKWENGWSIPDIENLIVLSDLYHISLDKLLKDEKADDNTNEELVENEATEPKNYEDLAIKVEQFFIVAVGLLTCLAPVIGLVLNIGLCVYCYVKKIKLKPICWVILFICITINISNAYAVISVEIPNWGRGNIEKIGSI